MRKEKLSGTEQCKENFRKNNGKPFKILMGFYKGNIWTVIKTVILLALKTSPAWVIPIVTANIINIATYSDQHSLTELWINAGILLIFLVQNIYTTFATSKVYDKFVREAEQSLRSALIQKLQLLSMSYHKSNNSGKLMSKIIRDCESVEALLASLPRSLFDIIVSGGIAVTVVISHSPIVALFFLVLVPVEVLLLRRPRKNIQNRNIDYRKTIEKTQSGVSEMLDMIPVTRAHGLQEREITHMDSSFNHIKNAGYEVDKANNLFGALSWASMQMAVLACLAFTGYLAYIKKIPVGDIVLYQSYFTQLVGLFTTLLSLYPAISKGMDAVNSISEILNEDKDEKDGRIYPLEEDMKGAVEFKNVYFKYDDGTDYVLNDFNVKVEPGQSLAFVGGSGAGKSTILNLLIGFDRPNDGQILIDRVNIANLDLTTYRHNIAVVPQNTILFSGTVRDNITYGIDNVSDEEIHRVIKDVGLEDVIDELPNGLDSNLGENGGKLSGGQRQRISIARALLRKPKIIIFDEATSALDSASEKKVQAAVDSMMKHCTTFLVAHRLSTIKNADRIAYVEKGKIAEIGSYDELMAKQGKFYELKKLQD